MSETNDRADAIRRHLPRNFLTNLCESSICMLGFGFVGFQTFLPVFLSLFTDSRLLIGLVGTAVPVGWLLPQLFVAPWVESLPRKKPVVIRLALLEKLLYLLLAILAFYSFQVQPALLVASFITVSFLIGLAGGVTRVGWGELMATIFPPAIRGRYFGTVSFTGGILGALGAYLGGLILAQYAPPGNFGLSFLIGCGVILFSWTFLFWIHEPPSDPPRDPARDPASDPAPSCPQPRPPSRARFAADVLALLRRDRDFARFILAQSAVVLSGMAYYFITVYGQSALSLDGYQLGLLATSLVAGTTLASPAFGWLGDRFGHRAALITAAGVQAAGFALALLAGTPAILLGAGFVIGMSRASSFVNAQPLVFNYAPVAQRPTYIGLSSTAFGLATMVAPLLGGIVAQTAGYGALFAMSILLSLLALAYYRHI